MKDDNKIPETLLEAVTYFADERNAWQCVVNQRWPSGNVTCPRCDSDRVHLVESRMLWNCNGCRRQFSAKIGTIFEDSPIKFSKWLPAMWLIVNCKNGISSCELARDLKVTQKTAWFMLHRIRLAMRNGSLILSGEVEADETYIGGKARNMHKEQRAKVRTGTMGKITVMGMLERGGKVVANVIQNPTRQTLRDNILGTVDETAKLFTDAHSGYDGLSFHYQHSVINHAVEYVNGNVHTNGIENFWSLLKRGLGGTYISVEAFHLFRYIDEQAFRFNSRKASEADRFTSALSQVVDRRLTYKELIGKVYPAGI